MKKFLTITLLAASTFVGYSQTNTPGFFSSVENYFTSFNTNLTTFSSEKLEVWAGADYQQNYNVSSSLGLEYKPFNNIIKLESVTRNAGIAGTILSQQAGVGVAMSLHDVEFGAYVDGGYQFDKKAPFIALSAEVKKALTENTYAGLRLESDFELKAGKQQIPILSVLWGFKF